MPNARQVAIERNKIRAREREKAEGKP